MSAPSSTIDFVRYSGRRGAIWLKDAATMLSAARVPWLMLLLSYYLIQLLVSVVPLASILKPLGTFGSMVKVFATSE